VSQFRFVFEGTNVARIRAVDDLSAAPLAWFRVVYADAANDVIAVHVYGHAEAVSNRPWLAGRPSLTEAVAYCDELHRVSSEGSCDWNDGSIESSPRA
jgi:hypothetical protein